VTAGVEARPVEPGERRSARLRQLWLQGLTLEDIGQDLRVTRERVRQLLNDLGLPQQDRSKRRFVWLSEQHGNEIVQAFLRLRDDAKVASELGFTKAEVRSVVDARVRDPSVLRRRPYESQPNYTDSELIDSLRAAAAALPSPLSHDDYNEWGVRNPMPDGRLRPTHQTMGLRWGSWRAALNKADLPTRPRSGPTSALSRQAVIWTSPASVDTGLLGGLGR
jgi:sigma-70-like protein